LWCPENPKRFAPGFFHPSRGIQEKNETKSKENEQKMNNKQKMITVEI
jgi:hypothetical protein